MACWITVHYPHPVDDGIAWVIYLKDKGMAQKLRRGDQVLFYCGQYPPSINGQVVTRIRRMSDGRVDYVSLEETHGGIVGAATVCAGVRPMSETTHSRYEYGNTAEWLWFVPCEGFRRGNLVTREHYRTLAGRGVAVRSGLYQIDERTFDRIMAALGLASDAPKAVRPPEDPEIAAPRAEPERLAAGALARCGLPDAERLLQRIGEVRGQPERNMEDVVKDFLVELGHPPGAITFQVGRIDIKVASPAGGTHMVVEVKRDLTRSRDEARRQGFDYAMQVDARLVVLSDADRYEVYDRAKGGSYEAMRVGGFQLTRFTEADAAVLDSLRPLTA
jgi:hypothetical protein